jgi:hypothetical protein
MTQGNAPRSSDRRILRAKMSRSRAIRYNVTLDWREGRCQAMLTGGRRTDDARRNIAGGMLYSHYELCPEPAEHDEGCLLYLG